MSRALVPAIWLALAWPLTASGQARPDAVYREIESEHFRVTYGPGLDALAGRALAAAEATHAYLVRLVSRPPGGKTDILLVDDVDFSNGFASPLPSNRVTIYARPPLDDEALSYSPGWIELVVSHEVTHIFHLDRAGAVGRAMRAVFGRMPLIYPMFPALSTPRWSTEGLAVDVESGFTGLGRLHGSNHEMVLRTAVLENRLDRMDRLNEHSPIWPGDQRAYIYGSLFMEYLTERYGEDVHRRLLDRTASAFLPPFLFFDNVAKRTFGESFDEAYAAFRARMEQRFRDQADAANAAGLTESEPVVTHGRWAIYPRVSRDGHRLAYTADDGRDVTETRVIDLASGREIESFRRNGISGQAWLPGGGLVYSQLEFEGPYRILFDLWRRGGEERGRLTKGERVQDPDASPDGTSIVAVRNGDGDARLVMIDARNGATRDFGPAEAGVLWSFPRWSPDGTRIAASRWMPGGTQDIVILDANGVVTRTIAGGPSLSQHPAWSPDGRYVLFSSDRSGITNLYAADLSGNGSPRLMQVTNVLTGAFFPEVTPDGASILFSKYHADGYAIERMAFDPAAWREPSATAAMAQRPSPEADRLTSAGPESRSFNAWRSLAPTYWQPALYEVTEAGLFLGAAVNGRDLIGRHSFSALGTVDARGSGRWEGYLTYSNARLGNPVLSLEASRSWDFLGVAYLAPDSTPATVLEREDLVAGLLTFVRRRWRNSASVSIGIEREMFTAGAISTRSVNFRDKRDRYWNLLARASFANARQPAYAISRENGFSVAATARHATEDGATVYTDSAGSHPEDYNEVRAIASLFRSIDPGGFAHQVIALHGGAFLSDGPGAKLQSVGSSSGGPADILGFGVAGGSRLLPVRAFEAGTLRGTHAWAASAEWRIPIAMPGRRPALSPLFIDRISLSLFTDAGDAWCTSDEQRISSRCRANELVVTPIISAGVELVLDVGFAGIFTGRIRAGSGTPLRGPDRPEPFWIQFGSFF